MPVIYTNYSSHAEFLGRGNAGVPVGGILQPEPCTCIWRMVADVAQAVEAARRLCFQRDLCAALGDNGRAFAQRFALETQARRWHEVFQRLVSGSGTGASSGR